MKLNSIKKAVAVKISEFQLLFYIVKTENEKRCFIMKVQAFCEEKGLRSFLGVFRYA